MTNNNSTSNNNAIQPMINQQQQQMPIVTTPSQQAANNQHTQNLSNSNDKRRGCRCGNATAAPGKLTCCGQRCPCYVDSKACIDCKCRGCRNPHYADGQKKVRGILFHKFFFINFRMFRCVIKSLISTLNNSSNKIFSLLFNNKQQC